MKLNRIALGAAACAVALAVQVLPERAAHAEINAAACNLFCARFPGQFKNNCLIGCWRKAFVEVAVVCRPAGAAGMQACVQGQLAKRGLVKAFQVVQKFDCDRNPVCRVESDIKKFRKGEITAATCNSVCGKYVGKPRTGCYFYCWNKAFNEIAQICKPAIPKGMQAVLQCARGPLVKRGLLQAWVIVQREKAKRKCSNIFCKIKKGFQKIGSGIKKGFQKMGAGLKKGFTKFGKAVAKGAKKVGKAFKKFGKMIVKGFKDFGKLIKTKIIDKIKSFGMSLFNKIKAKVSAMIAKVIVSLSSSIGFNEADAKQIVDPTTGMYDRAKLQKVVINKLLTEYLTPIANDKILGLIDKGLELIQKPLDAAVSAVIGGLGSIPFAGGAIAAAVSVGWSFGMKYLRKFVAGKLATLAVDKLITPLLNKGVTALYKLGGPVKFAVDKMLQSAEHFFRNWVRHPSKLAAPSS